MRLLLAPVAVTTHDEQAQTECGCYFFFACLAFNQGKGRSLNMNGTGEMTWERDWVFWDRIRDSYLTSITLKLMNCAGITPTTSSKTSIPAIPPPGPCSVSWNRLHDIDISLSRIYLITHWYLLTVADASGKIPAGYLYGNVYSLGNFDECLKVSVNSEGGNEFLGQYCLAQIFFSPMWVYLLLPHSEYMEIQNVLLKIIYCTNQRTQVRGLKSHCNETAFNFGTSIRIRESKNHVTST